MTQLRLHLHDAPEPGSPDQQRLLQQPLLFLPDGTHTERLDWDPPPGLPSSGTAGPAVAGGAFCSLADMLLPCSSAAAAEAPAAARLVAHYLRKGLITQQSNAEYLPLARVLLQLGAGALPGWQDTVLALNVMAASASGGQGAADKNRGSSRAGVLTD